MNIGFCGLGRMGTAMVLRLLAAGHKVTVWNRAATKLEPVVAAGARSVPTPAAVAINSEIVLLCLFDTSAVDQVVFGQTGIASVRTTGILVGPFQHLACGNARLCRTHGRFRWASVDRCTRIRWHRESRSREPDGHGGWLAGSIRSRRESDQGLRRSPHSGCGWADSKLLQVFVPRMTSYPANNIGSIATLLKDVESVAMLASDTGIPTPISGAVLHALRTTAVLGLGNAELSRVVGLLERAESDHNP